MIVRKMSILGFDPFDSNSKVNLEFCSSVNIIRGENGSGKTTIGELISLLGHLSCISKETLEIEEQRGKNLGRIITNQFKINTYVWFELQFRKEDIDFLTNNGFSEESVEGFFELIFYLNKSKSKHLKKILKSDALISEEIGIAIYKKHKPHLDAAYKICNFNRPKQNMNKQTNENVSQVELTRKTSKFLKTLGFKESSDAFRELHADLIGTLQSYSTFNPSIRSGEIISAAEAKENWEDIELPGLVSYINTDMYERGVGNDLRESPKDIEIELEEVFDRRFHLFLNEKESTIQEICFNEEIDKAFKEVMGFNSNEQCISINLELNSTNGKSTTKSGFLSVQDLADSDCGNNSTEEAPRNFISSGENQALFFIVMLKSLIMKNSIIIADEPELHLGFKIKWRFLEWFINFIARYENQVFIITHESLTLKDFIAPDKQASERELEVALFYIKRTADKTGCITTGINALEEIGESSRYDLEFLRSQLSSCYSEIGILKSLFFREKKKIN